VEILYRENKALTTIRLDWKGTPITVKHRFVNDEFPHVTKFSEVLKWKLKRSPTADQKKNDSRRLQVQNAAAFFDSTDDGLVWLGHASFFMRLGGVTFLTDPVYHKLPFVREWITIPNPIDDFPKVDFLLMTHDHRDHCDERSIKQLAQRCPNMKVHAGLEMAALLQKWVGPSAVITEHGWYQRWQSNGDVTIDFLPTRHWGRRGLTDTNRRLWGAFMVTVGGRSIYFGGDSGYGTHYADAAKIYPNIDIAILGIGAYSPRWFMHPSHMAPENAAQAFADIGAERLLPMHYGKYDLSDEPPGEPQQLMLDEMQKCGREEDLLLPDVGQVISLK